MDKWVYQKMDERMNEEKMNTCINGCMDGQTNMDERSSVREI